MNIRLVCSALIIGALTAVAVPQNLSVAQSNDQKASAPKSATPNTNMTPHKHRDLASSAVEGIRTMAVGEYVPNRPGKRHCRRRNEPPVGSLPANLAAAAVNEMFFLPAALFVVGLDFRQG